MKNEQDFIAHVKVEDDAFQIQTVKEHAVGTAGLSESFAAVFGAAAWGKQNGGWHDMGKYTKKSWVSIHAPVKDATACLWKALLITFSSYNFANNNVNKWWMSVLLLIIL